LVPELVIVDNDRSASLPQVIIFQKFKCRQES
jgi:hypothetical protein